MNFRVSQLGLLERLRQDETNTVNGLPADDVPVELLIGSTELVTNGLIELVVLKSECARFKLTERGRRMISELHPV